MSDHTLLIDAERTDDPVIMLSRVFDAPRQLVWEAITDPKHVVHWWGGHGFSNPVCEMDVREGGAWRHVMRAPDGSEYKLNFVFVEVEAPERLSWRLAEIPAHGPPPLLQTILLEDLGGNRTKWTVIARADSIAERDISVQMGFAQMVGQGAERMAAYLATL